MTEKNAVNRPFKKHEVEDYEKKRYRGIDQRLVHAREERIIKKILKKIIEDSQFALDVPCGYGRFSHLLLDKGFFVVNSDLSFHMVKRAVQRRQGDNRFAAAGVVADAMQGFPFKKNVFNILLSMRFFHHVHEAKEREFIIKEFFHASEKWVILSYYQANLLHLFQRRIRRKIKKSKTSIKMISPDEFQREVEAGGFRIVKIFPLFRGLHSHHIALLKKS